MTSTSRFTLMGTVATALAVAAPAGAQDAPPAPDPLGALPPAEEPAPAPESEAPDAGRSARRDTGNRPGDRRRRPHWSRAPHRRGPPPPRRVRRSAPAPRRTRRWLRWRPPPSPCRPSQAPPWRPPPPPRRRPPTQPPGRPHKRTAACCRSPPQRDWSCSRCSAPPSRCAAPGAGPRKRRSTSRRSRLRPPQPPSPSRCANPPSGAGRSWRRTTSRRGRPLCRHPPLPTAAQWSAGSGRRRRRTPSCSASRCGRCPAPAPSRTH